jgi:hypothetical protein
MKKLLTVCIIILIAAPTLSAQTVTLEDLKDYIGKPDTVKVCGKIYSARFLDRAERKPTLLNVGGFYPAQKLTVVIFEEDRKNFPPKPEEYFSNAQVCISGVVIDYSGKPEIVVKNSKQLEIEPLKREPIENLVEKKVAVDTPLAKLNISKQPEIDPSKREPKENLVEKKGAVDTPLAKLNIETRTEPNGSVAKENLSIKPTQDLKNSKAEGNYIIASANLRSGPSTDFPVIATLPKGSRVSVIYTNKIWSKVEVEILSKNKLPVNFTGYLKNADFE